MVSSISLMLILVIMVVRHCTTTNYSKIYAQDPDKVDVRQLLVDYLIDIALGLIALNMLWAFISAKVS